jgi:hypothetical protein
MVVFSRTASIAPGKTPSAMAFAKEISAYLKTTCAIELEVSVPIGGNPNRICWSTRYKDLAALEATNAKMTSDPKYWELVNKSADHFMAGSICDSMWRIV